VIGPAASPREAAPAPVRALWTDLLARLSLAAVTSAQPQTRLQLRALGVRRTGTVATNLAREILMAQRMAASMGVWIQPLALQRRVGELAQPATFACHLRDLATAYRHVMLDPAMPPGRALAKWLAERHRIHVVQSLTLEQIADPSTR